MLGNSTKIFEALATIKTDTKNHKEGLNELKDDFNKHLTKDDQKTKTFFEKLDSLNSKISNMKCPYDERIEKLEERYFYSQKAKADKILSEANAISENARKRALLDKKVAEDIASLKTRNKYDLMSTGGMWTVLLIILKKIFSW